MIRYSKKNREIIRENAFEQKKKKPALKFNPGLALVGLWTTEPRDLRDGPLEKLWGAVGNFRASGIFFRYQIPWKKFFRP